MTKRERAWHLIRDVEQRGGRFYCLPATGEFGLALGKLQLTRAERRELARHGEQIAALVFKRAQALARAAGSPASAMVN